MSNFTKGLGTFSAERSELFELLLRKRLKNVPQTQTIPRRKETGPCQLSFAQQRLWFLDQLEPGRNLYNISIGVRVAGNLNVAALRQSLDEILLRHEALRTTFLTVEGSPVQV